jgi:hypothetical protein
VSLRTLVRGSALGQQPSAGKWRRTRRWDPGVSTGTAIVTPATTKPFARRLTGGFMDGDKRDAGGAAADRADQVASGGEQGRLQRSAAQRRDAPHAIVGDHQRAAFRRVKAYALCSRGCFATGGRKRYERLGHDYEVRTFPLLIGPCCGGTPA